VEKELAEKSSLLQQYLDVENRIVDSNAHLLSENALLHQQIRDITSLSAELDSLLVSSPSRRSVRGTPGRD